MKGLLFTIALLLLGLWAYSFYFLATIFAISFLIFFHELGHFLVARLFGVAVNTFSIGFGEKIYKKRIGATEYCLSAIPLGGYVQLKGQDDADPSEKNYDKDSYNTIKPLGRIFILFAGPFFNFILAFLLYITLGFIGVDKLAPNVGRVAENSAGAIAGIIKDDKILSINGKSIRQWDEISKCVSTEPLTLEIERDGKVLTLTLTPLIGTTRNIFNEEISRPLIGISPSGKTIKLTYNGFDTFKFAWDETVEASRLIFKSFSKLINGSVPLKDVGGIVQMADITSKAAQVSLPVLLIIVALISVNLGVLNLLPIPALDGGHILFNLYELMSGRKINERVYVGLTYCGWVILLGLMGLGLYNDVVRLSGVTQ
ncbi:RIP metalloprotease RseP [Campylobacter sp. faydin G-140]|uniref:RIP metalloprotease RseP n=1 Tax=Campylobacter anatolicus TaxID=2829105 RepID=UPI001B986C7D|nr:RIP metalloprotease RseP [Campylobacter anatolicus]